VAESVGSVRNVLQIRLRQVTIDLGDFEDVRLEDGDGRGFEFMDNGTEATVSIALQSTPLIK